MAATLIYVPENYSMQYFIPTNQSSPEFLPDNNTMQHFTYPPIDTANTCYDMDCIWDRARKQRVPVLRPLTFILCLIGLLGIVGNIFVIFVFSRTRLKRTSTYLVLTLGIIDFIACSVVIPSTLLKEWLVEFKSDIVCKLAELLRNSAIISSAMILAAIAFDRFLLVYRKSAQDGNKHVTMAMILVTMVTGIALGVPPMLGVGVYMDNVNGGVVNIKVCLTNDQLISNEGLQIYWQIITVLFCLLIVTIIALYMMIFFMVYRHTNRTRQRLNKNIGSSFSPGSKQPFKTTSVLPFVGLSRNSPTPPTGKPTKGKKKASKFIVSWQRPSLGKMFKNKVSDGNFEKDGNVVSVKVIPESSSDSATNSSSNTPQGTNASTDPAKFKHFQATGNNGVPKMFQDTLKHTPALEEEGHTTSRFRQELILRNRSAHIKTTKVLCIITTIYIIAFLPMFLITHRVIKANEIAFYLYFINNAANPIIYSFMNKKFRQDIWKMFSCPNSAIWLG